MSTRPARIDQVVPSLGAGDAIGAHVVLLRSLLRDLGFESDIWCQGAFAETRHLANLVGDLDPRPRPAAWWLYHLSSGSPIAATIAARPEPKVLDYHNITPGEAFGTWVPWAVEEARTGHQQLELLAGVASWSVSDSSFNEEAVLACGVPPACSTVVPPLFDTERRTPLPGHDPVTGPDRATLERLGNERAGGGTDWLFVGRVTPSKGQHDVIKAFACYRRLFDPAARLHLVGGFMGDDYPRALERFARSLGLGHAVRLTGAVGDAELLAHYRSADVFVYASRHEGFCIPLVEAMHHGLPVVAHAAGAVPETAGGAALLLDSTSPVEVAAAANRVVTDADVRTRMADAGRHRAADFALDVTRTRWAEAIEHAVRQIGETARHRAAS